MKTATTITPDLRATLGLPDLAEPKDFARSVEPSGQPTDIHRLTASQMFGVPYDKVTEEQRRAGKTANYKRMYA